MAETKAGSQLIKILVNSEIGSSFSLNMHNNLSWFQSNNLNYILRSSDEVSVSIPNLLEANPHLCLASVTREDRRAIAKPQTLNGSHNSHQAVGRDEPVRNGQPFSNSVDGQRFDINNGHKPIILQQYQQQQSNQSHPHQQHHEQQKYQHQQSHQRYPHQQHHEQQQQPQQQQRRNPSQQSSHHQHIQPKYAQHQQYARTNARSSGNNSINTKNEPSFVVASRMMGKKNHNGHRMNDEGREPFEGSKRRNQWDDEEDEDHGGIQLNKSKFKKVDKKKFACPERLDQNGASKSVASHSRGGGGLVKRGLEAKEAGEADELPPALKGCDAKLIEQIENEIVDNGQPVSFADIAGLKEAKQSVHELVCWPMKRPELFTGLRSLPKGLLLFGPPGTDARSLRGGAAVNNPRSLGKTLIGKAIAFESGATFFSISASSLMSKWTGESERLVKTLFAVASHREPSVVFIDEVDSLLTQRSSDENEASRRLKTEFLVQLDGAATPSDRVLIVGATNRPHELDEAARRRFVKKLYIPLPEDSGRKELVQRLLLRNSNSLTFENIEEIVERTKGFSGADIRSLCQEAAMGPIRESLSSISNIDESQLPPISFYHFQGALSSIRPSVAQKDLDLYVKWNEEFGTFSRI